MSDEKKRLTELSETLGSLFECDPIKDLIRIRTPFTYPDGGSLDLFLEDDGSRISDMGETLRWLNMQTVSVTRTKRQQALINEICSANGLNLANGMISLKATGNLSQSIVALAQTCIQVSDVVMTAAQKTRCSDGIKTKQARIAADTGHSAFQWQGCHTFNDQTAGGCIWQQLT